ncbi:alpha/beta fold hydrolase [Devosia aurantiaca]|uniref:Alpha/beta hydrolase n=1 Tax=Devosia aurantiaca TaxID=2714858 RepID=A0A6M1SPS8_9HYPH|nr:alpha/beta hydrolase [Devosia aurantiaca]NGP17205.1 alpha/beta hydrolase [Devosia aurantiaca]
MPLIAIIRFFTTVISLIILGVMIYLAWSWYDGDLVREPDGDLVRLREDWRLYWALGLAAFSFLGKLVVAPLLARPDRGEKSKADRGAGQTIAGPNGSTLYVEDPGLRSGPTVILTHGWSMDSTIWHYAKRDLGRRFRVIVWDLPGLGLSKGPVSLENFAASLASVIAWSGADKVVLAGHSIGGMTIQTLARDNPTLFRERVAGVALLNTTFTNPLRTMILPRFMQAIRWPLLEPMFRLTILLHPLAWLSAWQSYLSGMTHLANRVGFGKYVTRSQLNHVSLLSTRNPQGEIAKGNLAMFRWDATAALAKVGVPVLLVAGEMDIVTKPSASVEIAAQAGSAAIRHIEGANHMGMLECAAQYNAALAAFVSEVQPVSAHASSGGA